MTEVTTNNDSPNERWVEAAERSPYYASSVSVMGIKTEVGVLVTVAGVSLGFAEPDGSEEDSEEGEDVEKTEPEGDKPIDNVALLKNCIETQTRGNTQRVARYLAEYIGKKVVLTELIENLQIPKIEIYLILKTIYERAQANRWPLLLSYSVLRSAGFFTRKKVFGAQLNLVNRKPQPAKTKAAPEKTFNEDDLDAAEDYANEQAREGEEEILQLLASKLGEKVSFDKLIKAARLESNPDQPISRIRANLKILHTLTNILGFEKNPRYPFYLVVDDRKKQATMHKNSEFNSASSNSSIRSSTRQPL